MTILKLKNKNLTATKNQFQYDVNIDRIVVSNKVPYCKKGFIHFIEYEDDEKGVPLCVVLPKMSRYRKTFDETKYLSFLIKDNELLGKYNGIWDKVSYTIKEGFPSEPEFNEKYLKTKI